MTDDEQFTLITDLNTKLQKALASNPLQEQLLRTVQDMSYTSAKSAAASERIADALETLIKMAEEERENV